jgi:cytochrome c-type protein NapB
MNTVKQMLSTYAVVLIIAAFGVSIVQAAEESIPSLRGVHGINELSEAPMSAKVILPDEGIHPRDIPHQPPLIPHKTDKTRISLMKNQCLGCHGKLEFKEVGATEIGKNHYINREGEELGHISTRYYFCTQCHAPQENLKPLVNNDFQSIVKKEDRIHVKGSRKKLIEELNKDLKKHSE